MLDVGLSVAERRAFTRALLSSAEVRASVEIMDRDEQVVAELTQHVLPTSQVDVDMTTKPDRMLQLELADVGRTFQFAPASPGQAGAYVDNFIRASRSIFVAELDRWVEVPVFHGPIVGLERPGDVIRLTAVGKESLGIAPAVAWRAQSYGRRVRITDAIRDIMRAQGERRFDMPSIDARLRHPVSLGRHSEPWGVCRKLAASVDRQLFYDGRGRLRLRAWPDRPTWLFQTGTGGSVIHEPAPTYDADAMRNVVEVLGPEPEGKAERMRYVAMPPRGHPLSPWSLARGGEPRILAERIELSHAKDMSVLRKRAERELADLMRVDVDVQLETVVVPHLEPGDMCAIVADGERTPFRARKFSIPLAAGTMTLGYHRRTDTRGRKR